MESGNSTITRPPPPSYYGTNEERDAPPRYSQTDPPSYESLYGRVQAARNASQGYLDFYKKCMALFTGTIGYSIAFALCFGVPVTLIVIGSLFMFDCPAEHFIPIYLVVGGCVSFFMTFLIWVDRCQKQRIEEHQRQDDRPNEIMRINTMLGCFLLAWFLAGNVWVYRTYGNFTTKPDETKYCNPFLYSFAFWLTTIMYMVLLLFCGCFCISSCIYACSSNSQRSLLSNSQQ